MLELKNNPDNGFPIVDKKLDSFISIKFLSQQRNSFKQTSFERLVEKNRIVAEDLLKGYCLNKDLKQGRRKQKKGEFIRTPFKSPPLPKREMQQTQWKSG